MPAKKERIAVRLETIAYGGWNNLQVAIEVANPKNVFVSFPTIEKILGYEPNNTRKKIASKSLKVFLGEGSSLVKFGSFLGLITNAGKGEAQIMSLLSLEEFGMLAQWEAIENQNRVIGRILAIGLIDSIRSIALEQLGIELKFEERNEWIKARLEGVEQRSNFTLSIQERYLKSRAGEQKVPFFAFSNPSDRLNVLLTGHPARHWVEKWDLEAQNIPLREMFSVGQLKRMHSVEEHAAVLVSRLDMKPSDAIEQAVEFYGFEVWPEDQLLGEKCPKTLDRNRKRAARKAIV